MAKCCSENIAIAYECVHKWTRLLKVHLHLGNSLNNFGLDNGSCYFVYKTRDIKSKYFKMFLA